MPLLRIFSFFLEQNTLKNAAGQIPIRSSLYKIVFAKTEKFSSAVNSAAEKNENQSKNYGIDDSIHYRLINELRYDESLLCLINCFE